MGEQAVVLAPGVWRVPLLGDFVNGFCCVTTTGR